MRADFWFNEYYSSSEITLTIESSLKVVMDDDVFIKQSGLRGEAMQCGYIRIQFSREHLLVGSRSIDYLKLHILAELGRLDVFVKSKAYTRYVFNTMHG